MIRIIDQLFAGWQPHDIVWYSWCMMAGFIILGWAIGAGVKNRLREDRGTDPERSRESGSSYDIPIWEEEP